MYTSNQKSLWVKRVVLYLKVIIICEYIFCSVLGILCILLVLNFAISENVMPVNDIQDSLFIIIIKFLRVLNFAFLYKTIEISNISTRKN